MALIIPHATMQTIGNLARAKDAKKAVFQAVAGYLDEVQMMFNGVLIAVYIRPEKTSGGVLRPDENITEDIWQGKEGLVLKLGPDAFVDDPGAGRVFGEQRVDVGDWVAARINDSWQLDLNHVPCRIVDDVNIRLRLAKPGMVF